MENFAQRNCENCGSIKFKSWEELSKDEKFLIERLPNSKGFSDEQRKKQRFCKRCFFAVFESEQNA